MVVALPYLIYEPNVGCGAMATMVALASEYSGNDNDGGNPVISPSVTDAVRL